jgi:hypothetical protein
MRRPSAGRLQAGRKNGVGTCRTGPDDGPPEREDLPWEGCFRYGESEWC